MSSLFRAEQLQRYKNIVLLLLKYARADIVDMAGLEEAALVEVEKQLGDSAPDPKQLVNDLESYGPTFIKLGQLLSTRPDLISPPYLEALARLQDKVAPFPYEQVEEIVHQELGVELLEVFPCFEPEPLASASLAQVHRAETRDGQLVAVKVQRPGIRSQIMGDLEAFERIVRGLETATRLNRRYPLGEIFDSLRKTLLRELDYQREAGNLLRLGHDLDNYDLIMVPQPLKDHTTSRVLTMTYVDGTKITALSPLARQALDGNAMASALTKAYLDQILVHGFFHADPHPGNVLVTVDNRLALLDLGMVSYLTPRMQSQLLKFLLAIVEGKVDEVATMSVAIGMPLEGYDPRAFRREIADVVLPYRDAAVRDLRLGRVIVEMARIAVDNGVRPTPALTMVGKALLNLDTIGRTLDPDFAPNVTIRQHAQSIMTKHLLKGFSPSNIISTVLEMNEFVQSLPSRLNIMMEGLATRQFEIKINAFDETRLMANLQKIANRIALGLVLAALIVGAALVMRVPTPVTIFGYPAIAMVLFLLAVACGFALVINIFIQDIWRK